MPRGEQNLTTIYLRDLDEQEPFIRYMLEKKQVTPLMLGRALFAAAADFYNAHGKFEFPVRIEPEAFHAMAAEQRQAGYAVPTKIDHLANAAAAERALAEPPRSKARRTRAKH